MANDINNGADGAYGSGGSLNNQMYSNVCARGKYVPLSGRGKERYRAKASGECLSRKKKFWEL